MILTAIAFWGWTLLAIRLGVLSKKPMGKVRLALCIIASIFAIKTFLLAGLAKIISIVFTGIALYCAFCIACITSKGFYDKASLFFAKRNKELKVSNFGFVTFHNAEFHMVDGVPLRSVSEADVVGEDPHLGDTRIFDVQRYNH